MFRQALQTKTLTIVLFCAVFFFPGCSVLKLDNLAERLNSNILPLAKETSKKPEQEKDTSSKEVRKQAEKYQIDDEGRRRYNGPFPFQSNSWIPTIKKPYAWMEWKIPRNLRWRNQLLNQFLWQMAKSEKMRRQELAAALDSEGKAEQLDAAIGLVHLTGVPKDFPQLVIETLSKDTKQAKEKTEDVSFTERFSNLTKNLRGGLLPSASSPKSLLQKLQVGVNNSLQSVERRAAAIEAIALLGYQNRDNAQLRTEIVTTLEEMFDQYAVSKKLLERLTKEKSTVIKGESLYNPTLAVELILALGMYRDANESQRICAALLSENTAIRVAAVETFSWRLDKSGGVPLPLVNTLRERDPAIRAQALWAISTYSSSRRFDWLAAGFRDIDVKVRVAAANAMQRLTTEHERKKILELFEEQRAYQKDTVNKAMLTTLLTLGYWETVPRWRQERITGVDLTIAKRLGECHTADARAIAYEFLTTGVIGVKHATIKSIGENWSVQECGALLLEGMGQRQGATTRQLSYDFFCKRWPPAKDYQFYPTQYSRNDDKKGDDKEDNNFQKMRQDFFAAYPQSLEQLTVSPSSHKDPIAPVYIPKSEELNTVEKAYLKRDYATMASHKEHLIPILEKLLDERRINATPQELALMLRKCLPIFKTIETISHPNTYEAKTAISQLKIHFKKNPPHRFHAIALYENVRQKIDPYLLLSVLDMIQDEPSETSQKIAKLAMISRDSEVRRRACSYFAKNGSSKNIGDVAKCLDDPSKVIQIAALKALGEMRATNVVEQIRNKLSYGDHAVRIAAAVALAKIGDEVGIQALQRYSRSQDESISRKAVEAMGEAPTRRYFSDLERVLEINYGIRDEAVLALEKITRGDPTTLNLRSKSLRASEKVKGWQKWLKRTSQASYYNDRAL